MTPAWRDVAIIVGAAITGALACLLFGASPATVNPVPSPEPEWDLVTMRVPEFDRIDAVWVARAPWGAAPVIEAPEEFAPPPPPPPAPVGVVGRGRNVQAIFMVHGVGDVRVPIGGALPDGGRLLGVAGMKIDWVDGKGERHERRLFIDPQTTAAGMVP